MSSLGIWRWLSRLYALGLGFEEGAIRTARLGIEWDRDQPRGKFLAVCIFRAQCFKREKESFRIRRIERDVHGAKPVELIGERARLRSIAFHIAAGGPCELCVVFGQGYPPKFHVALS